MTIFYLFSRGVARQITDALNVLFNLRIFVKLIKDYHSFMPMYKVIQLFEKAETRLSENDYRFSLDALWFATMLPDKKL